MLSTQPVSLVSLVIRGAVLMVMAVSLVQAQHRPRLAPPKALLEVLDKEDRDCVLTNGGLSKAVTVQSIQLTTDGTSQLLIRGSGICLCGAQNCGFWIYRKRNGQPELLLKGAGSIKVTAARSSSKGYRDITSVSHASAIETIIRTYQFDGQEYQLARCDSRAYYDDNGKPTRTPVTRPCTY